MNLLLVISSFEAVYSHIYNDGVMYITEGNPCPECISLLHNIRFLMTQFGIKDTKDLDKKLHDLNMANLECVETLKMLGDDMEGWDQCQ